MIYYIVFSIILVMAMISVLDKRFVKVAVGVIIVIMTLFAGLRHYSNWTDGNSYYEFWNHLYTNKNDYEYGFQLWNRLCKLLFQNYNLYLCITYFVIFTIYYTGFRTLLPGMEAYALFVLFSIFYLPSGGFRQYIAVSICFFSIQYWVKEDYFKYICCVLIATLFHRTAIIFILIFIFKRKCLTIKSIFIILMFACLLRVSHFFEWALNAIYNTGDGYLPKGIHYRIAFYFNTTEYNTLLTFGNIKRYLLFCFFIYLKRGLMRQKRKGNYIYFVNTYNSCLNIYFIGIVLSIIVLPGFNRLNIYFYVTEIILESCTLKIGMKEVNKLAIAIIYAALNAFIYIYNLNTGYIELFFPYKFCF